MNVRSIFKSGSIALIVVFLFSVAFVFQADSQDLRFGYVNSGSIMTQFEEAQQAQRQFENIVVGWENNLRQRIQDLQEKYDDFQARQGMMNEQARIEEQQRLVELEQEINQFRMEKFGQGGEIVTEQERIFRPVREKILDAIEVIARQENLNFVLDKTDEIPVLLYAERRYDITFKVLDYLKRGSE